jgi:2-succinyl-5-enolpyruvyl-6-hydroxy-3-cyclohexene-1-carboxylate synthase
MNLPAPQNPSHALAVVVVDELVRGGVTDAVLAPGSRSTALAMTLHADPRIRLHVEIDERSAGFLAIGLARASGRPAAVVTTSGTAVANLHPAVLEADAARVPLLLFTADRPPELRHTGANQTIDQLKLFGDAVRWFVEVGVPEDRPGAVAYWRATVARGLFAAAGSPAGPVHLNLAFREPTVPAVDDGRSAVPHPFSQPIAGRPDGDPWVRIVRGRPQVPDDAIAAMADRIARTPRGLLVVGDTRAAAGPIHALAAAAGWPIVAEPTAPARHGPHLVVHANGVLSAPAFLAAHRPDLIVTIGRPTVSAAVGRLLAGDAPQVVVDPDGAWLDPARTMAELVVADPDAWCQAVADRLDVPASSDWLDAWRTADGAAAAAIAETLGAQDGATEPGVARAVHAAVPAGGALVVASSMPIRDLDAFAAPRSDIVVHANRGVSGIDGFVSTALGVALAHPGPTVALAGDLSFLHDRNGLLLAADGDPDLVLVVSDNDGGGIFHFLPQAEYPDPFERVFGTPHGLDLADVARTHGLGYRAVTTDADVASAVGELVAVGGRHLVHVRTDRRANRELHRELQAAITAAVARTVSEAH